MHELKYSQGTQGQHKTRSQFSGSAAKIILSLLESAGIKRHEFIHSLNIDPKKFTYDNDLFSLREYREIITQAMDLLDDDSLGLRVGSRMNVTAFGELGFSLMTSQNLGQAFASTVQYWESRFPMIKMQLTQDTKLCHFILEEQYAMGATRRYALDAVLALHASFSRFVCGQDFPFIEIHYQLPPPKNVALYEDFFGCPVKWRAKKNQAIFLAEQALWPISYADPFMHQKVCGRLEKNALSQQHNAKQPWRHLSQELIVKALPAILSTQQLADKLHVSPRTLARHLAKEATGYRQLLNEARKNQALVLLQQGHRVQQVAALLGFKDSPSFSRAFVRWFGQAPSHYLADE